MTSPPPSPMWSYRVQQSLNRVSRKLLIFENNLPTFDRFERSPSVHSYPSTASYDDSEQRASPPPTPPTPSPPSKEEAALRSDIAINRRTNVHIKLEDLPRGHQGGIFDINPDAPESDEERVR
ncbi:hypothetical protein AJ80_00410 [Polytolypa hystricis UAMH7299]|uniref:Uncharacterized protein n=1 Tax=Polytolypa hystricis (strain UAMH7299) TaxID=1447883 RepID=A0A2B7Z377_POLH7|nr:hypothetical protein AJ80_00410 [Polytolypa hystricis UAMH7299]